MKYSTCFVACCFFLLACDSKQSTQNTPASNAQISCYRFANESDTISLNMNQAGGDSVQGSLIYQLKEKEFKTQVL